jgi:hypothetical protein
MRKASTAVGAFPRRGAGTQRMAYVAATRRKWGAKASQPGPLTWINR